VSELIAFGVGAVLLYAALVKAGSSPVTWLLFRWRLGRLHTACLALLLRIVLAGWALTG
jgi:hypothetical protein